LVGGLPPYHAKKIMYYLDDRFRARAWLKPPESARARRGELPVAVGASGWSAAVAPSPLEPAPPSGDVEGSAAHSVPVAEIGPPSSLGSAWAEAFGATEPESSEHDSAPEGDREDQAEAPPRLPL
jgi:type IV secretion system protein VirD4